jgi:photosystem II stability/assembly factor-like uncharacterized protein
MADVVVLVGTRKGLFRLRSDEGRRSWEVEGPDLTGWEVMHAIADPRDGSLYACSTSFVYGATVHRSTDGGATWERSEQVGLPEESGLTLEKLWHVRPGHESRPGEVWLGGTPAVLFRSADSGQTWEPVRGILEHPTRVRWQPGAGGLCCHTIQLDQADPNRIYVAISAAGAFRSDDDGDTWTPINRDVAADFLPDPNPEVGQCVHKLAVHPEQPERLWQQNHCGVYRSDDRGDTWERLDRNGLPSDFGFPIMIHPRDPDLALVIPEEGAMNRVTANGRLGVYRTRDAGTTWELAADGLPEQAWSVILREASASDGLDPAGFYFGTQGGSVFVSPSEGEDWVQAVSDLPPVLSVEVASWQS